MVFNLWCLKHKKITCKKTVTCLSRNNVPVTVTLDDQQTSKSTVFNELFSERSYVNCPE